ncbi:MAG: hypothetical protein JWM14_715 [Chitinophagaceae bacterium]|nr:hypothetical protein [Chitinophagaceae bacterium]
MKAKNIFPVITLFLLSNLTFAQTMNLDEYEIYLNDTSICKSAFLEKAKDLDSTRLKNLSFRPITDGQKTIYYLNGSLYGKGEIRNKKEKGFWTYWHDNGQKAREGSFTLGKREGTHTYWYPNGKIRGIGNFKHDVYDGEWIMYKEDGSDTIRQFYKKGKLVNK